MVCLQEEWLTPQVVCEVADSVVRCIGFLLEGIPARSDVAKLLACKTYGLMDDSKIARPLLVKDRSYRLVRSVYPQHPVEVIVRYG